MSTSIHQEIDLPGSPERVYAALMTSEGHAAFTGGPADISDAEGGAFTCHGGAIAGRNVELVPNERIVQAWRVGNWEPGVYSLVKFELHAVGSGTRLVLDHTGTPEAATEHLAQGWHDRYWTPLAKYLG